MVHNQPTTATVDEAQSEEELTPEQEEQQKAQGAENQRIQSENTGLITLGGVIGFGVLSKGFEGYHNAHEIYKAYETLQEKIDPRKLFTDPEYAAKVRRSIHYAKINFLPGVRFDERMLQRASKALEITDLANERRFEFKMGLMDKYLPEVQKLYGLTDVEIMKVKENAAKQIDYNKNLSMQDLVRIEAQKIVRGNVVKEAHDKGEDPTADEIKKRGDEKIAFLENNGKLDQYNKITGLEKEKQVDDFTVANAQKRMLSLANQPSTVIKEELITPSSDHAPQQTLLVPLNQAKPNTSTKPAKDPFIIRAFRFKEEIKKGLNEVKKKMLEPFVKLKNKITDGFKKVFKPITDFKDKIKGKILSFFSPIQKTKDAIKKQIRDVIFKQIINRILKSAIAKAIRQIIQKIVEMVVKLLIKIAAKIGIQIVANTIAPVLGGAIAFVLTEAFEKLIKPLGYILLGIMLIIPLLLVLGIIGVGTWKSVYFDTATRSRSYQYQNWNDFEKSFLAGNIKEENFKSWMTFENKYLNPFLSYLSLEK